METSVASDHSCECGDNTLKALWNTVRKPCLTINFDLQMQMYSDYDTAPHPAKVDGKRQQPATTSGASQPLCDKSETVAVKWRIADMVITAAAVSVALSMLSCIKRLCAHMK